MGGPVSEDRFPLLGTDGAGIATVSPRYGKLACIVTQPRKASTMGEPD
jgi:hypothetical protein